jgi:DNA (cytosine-5)-methyltransferase 1
MSRWSDAACDRLLADVARPRLLDLFCKQGGAAVGYHRAGFDIVGVDLERQPRYPFEFVQADARNYAFENGREFDAIHASPPCQRYTTGGRVANRLGCPDLVGDVRALLDWLRRPYVMENVPGAPMRADVVLCGSMFGLKVRRHRIFESNVPIDLLLPPCDHSEPIAGVYGRLHGKAGAWPGMLPSTLETWSAAMGIDWMDADGLSQAIPPAYTEWIGRSLIRVTKGDGA